MCVGVCKQIPGHGGQRRKVTTWKVGWTEGHGGELQPGVGVGKRCTLTSPAWDGALQDITKSIFT